MDVDVTQALKDTENSLRDFIAAVLRRKFGEDWIEKCGVSTERLEKWRGRKVVEEKKQKFAVVEERLIYYADFYDLKTILKKHWDGEFSQAMGDWKTMEVWLDELGRLRDPEAHRRELLPHQKHLALGIAGEIRTRLIRYRSKQETLEDYFPRIESARDNFGNIWPSEPDTGSRIYTKTILRPEDIIEFIITASDPFGDELEYGISIDKNKTSWQKINSFAVTILEDYIGEIFSIDFYIRSPRIHRAFKTYDDNIGFRYAVLPKRNNL